MKKNDKQKRVKEIGAKLLSVQMEEHETKEYEAYYSTKPVTTSFSICNINGLRWIVLSDLNYGMNGYVRKMKADGLIEDYQILHVRTLTHLTGSMSGRSRWQIHTLVQLAAVAACKDELIGTRYLFNPHYHYERQAEAVIDAALAADVKTVNFFTEEQIEENERLYEERNRLIAESSKEKREQKQREELAEAIGQTLDEEGQNGNDSEEEDEEDVLNPLLLLADKMVEIIGENQNLRKQVEAYKTQKECLEKIVSINEKIELLRKSEIERMEKLNQQLMDEVRELRERITNMLERKMKDYGNKD